VGGYDSQLACNSAIKGGGFGIEAGRADAPGCWTLLAKAQKIREAVASSGLAWCDKPIRIFVRLGLIRLINIIAGRAVAIVD
jgi:hypothetical protein